MEDVDHRRHQRQPDHDDQERQVADPLPLRDADRHVAEDARDADEPQDRDRPTEGAAGEQQQHQRPDGIGRDPLRCERETEQHADHRHRHPERGPAAPPARPDRGEDRVRGHDEQPDVDVVHPDPRLDEEHPVEQHERGDDPRDEPPPEQDPGEEVQAGGHEHARDDARQTPGERVRADVDAHVGAVRAEHEQLLAVVAGVARLHVHGPGRRLHLDRQGRIRVDRVLRVRLDDIHRPRAVGPAVRHVAQDVDLLARVVVRDAAAETGQRVRPQVSGSVHGRVATDGDDLVPRLDGVAGGHVQLRIADVQDHRHPVRAAGHRDAGHDPARRRIDERDAVRHRDGDPREIDDVDARRARRPPARCRARCGSACHPGCRARPARRCPPSGAPRGRRRRLR